MRIHTTLLTLTAVAGLSAGCAGEAPVSPMKVVATNKQIMNAIIVPASNAVFNVASEEPKDGDAWTAVANQAIALTEAGNLLMIGNRLQDSGDWVKFSQAMIDAGVVALKAAESKNVDAVSMAGDQLLETCSQCHDKYIKTPEAK